MGPEKVRMLAAVGILVFAPLYGSWIGTVSKKRSWAAGRLGQYLLLPVFVAVFAGIGTSDGSQVPLWARISAIIAVLVFAFLFAFLAAARSSGVPLMNLFLARPSAGDDLKGKSDLSIR
jgi:hypothetical protein